MISESFSGSWVRDTLCSSRGELGSLPKPEAGGRNGATSPWAGGGKLAGAQAECREVARSRCPRLAKVCGALRVGQVALGVNTQESRSGWQREDGQQVGGALGRPASLAGSPDPKSEDRDLTPYPTRWCSRGFCGGQGGERHQGDPWGGDW